MNDVFPCPSRKRPYATAELAQSKIDDLVRHHKTPRKRVRQLVVYACRLCDAYHFGHNRRRRPST